jgi:Leishmanolysin
LLIVQYAVGIGTVWNYTNVTASEPNCDYMGGNATREFSAISGCSSVPVEKDFGEGTACGHWDEDCMGDELMTGFIGRSPTPLSRITVATLQDMGYQVNYDKADPFGRSDLDPSCVCATSRLRERSVLKMKHGEVFSVGSVASGASGRPRRRLSETAEAAAIEAGLAYLQTKAQENSNAAQLDDLGIAYVADKVVSVLVLEDEEIYGVTVLKPND